MIQMDNCYCFYKLPEPERIKLVGQVFSVKTGPNLYFPIIVANPYCNYNVGQGLIFVTHVVKSKGKEWFRVGACSPDDLNADLDFDDGSLRDKVIEYIKTMPKEGVTYRGILLSIQNHFNSGKITS